MDAMGRAVEELNRRLLRARDAMDRTYAQPLDVPSLARMVHQSEAHFIRSFRATFGETPHRYLQRRRIERAMFLLWESDRRITDICMEVGFTSLGTFSRTFREIVGQSPSAYRARGHPITAPTCFAMSQDLGFMRWLTVCAPGHPEHAILLERPAPPSMDEATGEQLRELITKGAAGWVGLNTDDCRKTYESSRPRAWSSSRSPWSATTGSTARCATPSGTRSGSSSPRSDTGARDPYLGGHSPLARWPPSRLPGLEVGTET